MRSPWMLWARGRRKRPPRRCRAEEERVETKQPAIVGIFICVCTLAGGARSAPAPSAAPAIPLCPSLTVVTAVSEDRGDYESIKTVESVSPTSVQMTYSMEAALPGQPHAVRKARSRRTILTEDLASATRYARSFGERLPDTLPGTTALGTSKAVLTSLKTTGRAELGVPNEGLLAVVAGAGTSDVEIEFESQIIRRVGSGPVKLPVLVNDVRVELPAIHAEGMFFGKKAEFYFLDNPDNPLALQYTVATGELTELLGELTKLLSAATESEEPVGRSEKLDTLRVVSISHRCGGPSATAGTGEAGSAGTPTLEAALAKSGRAEVYDIFFSFNSADIREESGPTLKEIAGLLEKHADWKLSIEGHTDSSASDGFNLDLSRKRAAAVKDALVTRHRIDASRLATAGYGEARPRDTNDTLEGRARNRRVELVRQPE
jgi:outer membrane protein OmpA-like peptidoglycan-associated protein